MDKSRSNPVCGITTTAATTYAVFLRLQELLQSSRLSSIYTVFLMRGRDSLSIPMALRESHYVASISATIVVLELQCIRRVFEAVEMSKIEWRGRHLFSLLRSYNHTPLLV
jgi:hypothetical protein